MSVQGRLVNIRIVVSHVSYSVGNGTPARGKGGGRSDDVEEEKTK